MANQAGTLELLLRELGAALAPLGELVKPQGVESLGLRMPPVLLQNAQLLADMDQALTASVNFGTVVGDLGAAIEAEDTNAIVQQGVTAAAELVRLVRALVSLGERAEALGATVAGLGAEERARLEAFAAELPRRVVDYLFVRYLENKSRLAVAVLNLIGLVDVVDEEGVPGDASRPPFRRRELHFERIQTLFTEPGELLRQRYGWGETPLEPTRFFAALQRFFDAADVPVDIFETAGVKTFEAYLFSLKPNNTTHPSGLDFSIRVPATESIAFDLPSHGVWSSRVEATATFEAGLPGTLTPPLNVEFRPPTGSLALEAKARTTAEDTSGPMVLFGSANGTRAEVQRLFLELGVRALVDTAGKFSAEPLVGGGIEGAKLVIDMSNGDGFLTSVTSGVKIEGGFDLQFLWGPTAGLQFQGSGAVEIAIPAHIDLGPLKLETIYLILTLGNEAGLKLETSASLGLQLGPLAAAVERMGAEAILTFAEGGNGNLGPMDLSFRFKPPSGIGLSIDAGPVKGGGYLYFDFDREEYAGALELVFSEWIALRAIGLITTRMPDGSKGFSMLIIITVEFGTGIQLGFGFTLMGVGGLLGIHRVAKIEPLAEGVRTNAIESVMFPQDIIANAPRIISDLRAFFPPQKDVFLLGPMAKIGWGTPTLLTVSLGIILEIPSINITILGVIKVVLPDEKADLLRLQVNFIGRLEPSNKLLWFYAELYDSRVLFITLEGGMGLLVNWGDQANFVVSVGGFHPRYTPPPLPFPSPPRLALSILDESFARIRIEAYFAVTSNSVQFGAHAELFFGVDAFNIEGHLGFDALFQFDPFFFSFGLSCSLSVKVFGIGLFSVGFSGLLEGPTPWHIEGHGSISLLFFDISVPFSHTWGDGADTALEPIEVFPLLETELDALTNWRAELPATNNIGVVLRQLGGMDADRLVLHPVGVLKVSQRRVPLRLTIDKVGNQRPSDVNELTLEAKLDGGGDLAVTPVKEPFATGQYIDLDEADRLSKPGFSSYESGVEIAASGEQYRTSSAVKRVIRYETVIIDSHFKRFVRPFYDFFSGGLAVLNEFLFAHFLKGNAVTQAPASRFNRKRLQPHQTVIEVGQPHWSVAFNEDNVVFGPGASFESAQEAQQFLARKVSEDPLLESRLHVIPDAEVNRAA